MNSIASISASPTAWQARKPDPAKLSDELLSKLDTDGTGTIDQAELASAVKQVSAPDEDAAVLMTGLDSDGDKLISKQELGAGMQALSDQFEASFNAARTSYGADAPPPAEEVFSLIDSDGGGAIGKSELEAFMSQKPAGGPDADAVFAKLDADGNEQISEDELAQGMKKVAQGGPPGGAAPAHGAGGAPPQADAAAVSNATYDEADTNQDGSVTIEERLAYQDKQDAKRDDAGLAPHGAALERIAALVERSYAPGTADGSSANGVSELV